MYTYIVHIHIIDKKKQHINEKLLRKRKTTWKDRMTKIGSKELMEQFCYFQVFEERVIKMNSGSTGNKLNFFL